MCYVDEYGFNIKIEIMKNGNKSWDRAFGELNANVRKNERLNKIANSFFPLPDNSLRSNFIGLSDAQKDEIYEEYFITCGCNTCHCDEGAEEINFDLLSVKEIDELIEEGAFTEKDVEAYYNNEWWRDQP